MARLPTGSLLYALDQLARCIRELNERTEPEALSIRDALLAQYDQLSEFYQARSQIMIFVK